MRALVLLSTTLLMFATAGAAENEDSSKTGDKSETSKKPEVPPEKASVTSHSVQIGGRAFAYKAKAGTLLIRDDKGKPDASVFYVAYTVDAGKDSAKRPVTFLYNGGPGSTTTT